MTEINLSAEEELVKDENSSSEEYGSDGSSFDSNDDEPIKTIKNSKNETIEQKKRVET